MDTKRKPIPGFERYEMDTDGNVYAMFPHQGIPAGRKIKSRVNLDGYVTVTLAREGRGLIRTIHRLLMLTFHPVDNSHLLEVNHIDLVKSNNRLDNLEWMTHQNNIIHAHKMNAWAEKGYRGEQINTAKLTADQVREIRKLYQAGVKVPELVRKFGVTQPNMRAIVLGKTWRHVE